MDIYTFKHQFEQKVRPSPSHEMPQVELAWEYFEAAMGERVSEVVYEEIGFSMGHATYQEGKSVRTDEALFQVYFGRLMDAQKGCPWRTALIDFYYRFAMNAQLRSLLSRFPLQDVETAFYRSESEEDICQKIESVVTYANQRRDLWTEIRGLKPVQASFQFWIQ